MYLFQWFARAVRDSEFYESELAVLMEQLIKILDTRISDVVLTECDVESLVFGMNIMCGTRQTSVTVLVKASLDTLIRVFVYNSTGLDTSANIVESNVPVRRLIKNSFYQALTQICPRENFRCMEFKL